MTSSVKFRQTKTLFLRAVAKHAGVAKEVSVETYIDGLARILVEYSAKFIRSFENAGPEEIEKLKSRLTIGHNWEFPAILFCINNGIGDTCFQTPVVPETNAEKRFRTWAKIAGHWNKHPEIGDVFIKWSGKWSASFVLSVDDREKNVLVAGFTNTGLEISTVPYKFSIFRPIYGFVNMRTVYAAIFSLMRGAMNGSSGSSE